MAKIKPINKAFCSPVEHWSAGFGLDRLIERYGVDTSRPSVVFVGRITRQKGVPVLLTSVHEQPLDMLRKIKIVPDLIPEEHLFEDIQQCTTWLERQNRPDGLIQTAS